VLLLLSANLLRTQADTCSQYEEEESAESRSGPAAGAKAQSFRAEGISQKV
jgi:hypothetical protein